MLAVEGAMTAAEEAAAADSRLKGAADRVGPKAWVKIGRTGSRYSQIFHVTVRFLDRCLNLLQCRNSAFTFLLMLHLCSIGIGR